MALIYKHFKQVLIVQFKISCCGAHKENYLKKHVYIYNNTYNYNVYAKTTTQNLKNKLKFPFMIIWS